MPQTQEISERPGKPPPSSWRIALPQAPAAVPMARALVRTALRDLRAAAYGHTAELLTAELVSNAVEHARGQGPIQLVVERVPAGCQVEVHGSGHGGSGRGLMLMQALSSASGCRPTPHGKAVWFTLPA